MTSVQRKPGLRSLIAILIVSIVALVVVGLPSPPVNEHVGADPSPTPRKRAKRRASRTVKPYEFEHSTVAHQKDCASCHKFPSANWKAVRSEDVAFEDLTDYPEHTSCVGCHKQQFFKGTPPKVCSVCHTNPSPRNSARHPFPNPREAYDQSPKGKAADSDFVVGFPHDKHIEIVSAENKRTDSFVNASFGERRRPATEESCVVCHQTMTPQGTSDDEYITAPPETLGDAFWLKKGTFKSAPIGHTACFTCHSTDSGMLPEPQSCGTCHKLEPPQPTPDFDAKLAAGMTADKVTLDAWRMRKSAGTFRHEFFAHVELSCSTCHNVMTMNTADPTTFKVSIAACATCHATATSDDGGAINYEIDERKANRTFQCVKCHVTFGKLPVPPSHTKAISDAAGK